MDIYPKRLISKSSHTQKRFEGNLTNTKKKYWYKLPVIVYVDLKEGGGCLKIRTYVIYIVKLLKIGIQYV